MHLLPLLACAGVALAAPFSHTPIARSSILSATGSYRDIVPNPTPPLAVRQEVSSHWLVEAGVGPVLPTPTVDHYNAHNVVQASPSEKEERAVEPTPAQGSVDHYSAHVMASGTPTAAAEGTIDHYNAHTLLTAPEPRLEERAIATPVKGTVDHYSAHIMASGTPTTADELMSRTTHHLNAHAMLTASKSKLEERAIATGTVDHYNAHVMVSGTPTTTADGTIDHYNAHTMLSASSKLHERAIATPVQGSVDHYSAHTIATAAAQVMSRTIDHYNAHNMVSAPPSAPSKLAEKRTVDLSAARAMASSAVALARSRTLDGYIAPHVVRSSSSKLDGRAIPTPVLGTFDAHNAASPTEMSRTVDHYNAHHVVRSSSLKLEGRAVATPVQGTVGHYSGNNAATGRPEVMIHFDHANGYGEPDAIVSSLLAGTSTASRTVDRYSAHTMVCAASAAASAPSVDEDVALVERSHSLEIPATDYEDENWWQVQRRQNPTTTTSSPTATADSSANDFWHNKCGPHAMYCRRSLREKFHDTTRWLDGKAESAENVAVEAKEGLKDELYEHGHFG